MHVHRLQLGQGIHSGQFDQHGMCEAKAGIFRENVLRIKRAGLLADKPERVAGNLIGLYGTPSIWIELTGMGTISADSGVPVPIASAVGPEGSGV